MNNSTAVSVIVPNYNHEAYLTERIESILAQTYQNFELILLDDCSTDNSTEVINRYRDHPKVSQVVINTVNSGTTFKQWARGIELARHEWVWIAESDDWCEPTLLQTLVAGINAATCIAFCMSMAIEGNNILYVNESKYVSKNYPGLTFVREKMLRVTPISNASQAIFRKNLYAKIDKSFTTYKFSGDWLFWMLVAQHGEVHVSGKVLNYFRKHPKDVTSPSLKNGMAYREYIQTADILERQAVVTAQEKAELLMHKFNQLLWDHRVEAPYVTEISQLYHAKLGSSLLSLAAYRAMGKRSYFRVLSHKLLGK
jgi:glycosyltransferase involved in cell wall biosynthesis